MAAPPPFLRLTWTVKKPPGTYVRCNVCKKAHHKCDGGRPCGRCIRLQRSLECIDPPSLKRGRPTLELYDNSRGVRADQAPVRVIRPEDAAILLPINPVVIKMAFDNQNIISVSEGWLRMMDVPHANCVLGLPWFHLLPPPVVPLAVAEWAAMERTFANALKQNYTLEMTAVALTKSGKVIRTLARHYIQLDDNHRVKSSNLEVIDVYFVPMAAVAPPKMWTIAEEDGVPTSGAHSAPPPAAALPEVAPTTAPPSFMTPASRTVSPHFPFAPSPLPSSFICAPSLVPFEPAPDPDVHRRKMPSRHEVSYAAVVSPALVMPSPGGPRLMAPSPVPGTPPSEPYTPKSEEAAAYTAPHVVRPAAYRVTIDSSHPMHRIPPLPPALVPHAAAQPPAHWAEHARNNFDIPFVPAPLIPTLASDESSHAARSRAEVGFDRRPVVGSKQT